MWKALVSFLFVLIMGAASMAQVTSSTVVEGDPNWSFLLSEAVTPWVAGPVEIESRDRAVQKFCENSGHDVDVLILSSRLTDEEASKCTGPGLFVEAFTRNRGYAYFNLDRDVSQVLPKYRMWTGFVDPTEDSDLNEFLRDGNKPSLQDLLKTNAPETCTTKNALACQSGYFCCKGTCIEEGKECKE